MEDQLQSALRYGFREPGNLDSFWMRFDAIEREPEPFRAEVFSAAHRIAHGAGKPLWLAISGGMDSEIMARAFFDQGINFSAITLAYSGGINDRDVERAKRWCYDRGVPHEIISIDTAEFLTHGVNKYITAGYRTKRIYRYVQLRLLELIEERRGYGVLGNGKITFGVRDDRPHETVVMLGHSYAVPYEWCRRNETRHQPYFYFSYPELVLAYFRMPFVHAAVEIPAAFRNVANNVSLRRFLFQTAWPEIPGRPSFRGFERLPGLKADAEARMRAASDADSRVSHFAIADTIRHLTSGTT